MTWTIRRRNQYITHTSDGARNRLAAWHLKNALLEAGWTCIGSGTGTGGAGALDGTDRWSAAPTLGYAWIGLKNAENNNVLFQCYSTGGDMYMARNRLAYPNTSPAATATAWPDRSSIPATEVTLPGTYAQHYGPASGSDFYLNVATSDDGCSFLEWGRIAASAYVFGTAMLKVTDVKAGDIDHYWTMRGGNVSMNAFQMTRLRDNSYFAGWAKHPLGVSRVYPVLDLRAGSYYLMDSIGADPVSTKQQLVEVLVGCLDGGNYHLRGKLPGVYRSPSGLATGDSINGGDYVIVGDMALPWFSTTPIT